MAVNESKRSKFKEWLRQTINDKADINMSKEIERSELIMEEQVVCFKKEGMPYPSDKPIIPYDELLWDWILNNLHILPRSLAEQDYRFKQLVVYVIIKAQETYLFYKRTPKTVEERLTEKYSLGIGGHVNAADKNQLTFFGDFIQQTIWREINEEINIHSRILNRSRPELICFINDERDDVGRVHFGIVWLLKIREPKVTRKGRGMGKLDFLELPYLRARRYDFEPWSQLLIDYFTEKGEEGN